MEIQNIEQYKAHKLYLENKIELAKAQLSEDFNNLKAEINPVRRVVDSSQKLFVESNENNGLVNFGLNIGVDALLRNTILRNSSFLIRLVVPFFAKNLLSNYVANHKGDLVKDSVSWIKDKVIPENKPITNPSKPKRGLLEKTLIWVKDVTSEKPKSISKPILIDNHHPKKHNEVLIKTV